MEIQIAEKEKTIEACRQQLKQISRLLLADEIPQNESVDILIFNTRAVGDTTKLGRPGNDETGLFEHVGRLFDTGKVKNVLLFGSDGQQWDRESSIKMRYELGMDKMKANAGVSEYLRKLSLVSNIGSENIFFGGVEMGNAREENIVATDKMISHKEWKTAASITHPHQALRNAAGQINEAKNRGLKTKIYFIHPEKTDWDEEVFGSQSKDRMLRRDHALPEMQRVAKYTVDLKNLATPDEVLKYLAWRDGSLDRLNLLVEKKMQNPDFQKDIEVVENAINSLSSEQLEGLTNLQN